MKLKNFFLIVIDVLKLRSIQQASAFAGLVSLVLNFFRDNVLKQLFYIQNREMCLNKKILHQYFVVFYPAWDNFSSKNIFYVIA